MISKNYIETTLDELDKLYNTSTSQKKSIYYSKLAVIELCGWLEDSMDNIIEKYCNGKLKNLANKKYVKDNILTPNHGFHYQSNFRPMLMNSIGIIELEKLEEKLESTGAKIEILKSTLGRLKTNRNLAAHTFIKGVTNSYDAPSVVKNDFRRLYPILKEIELEIRRV